MNNRGYYVLKQCHEWQYVPELGQSVRYNYHGNAPRRPY